MMTPEEIRKAFFCVDCAVDTYVLAEYYAVTDELRLQHGADRGMLCLTCLERRMGRQLVPGDFNPNAPINFVGHPRRARGVKAETVEDLMNRNRSGRMIDRVGDLEPTQKAMRVIARDLGVAA